MLYHGVIWFPKYCGKARKPLILLGFLRKNLIDFRGKICIIKIYYLGRL